MLDTRIETQQETETTPIKLPSWRDLLFLFLAFLLLFSYSAPRWNDWNQNSRLSLVRAIVEDGSVRIDRFQQDTNTTTTGDFAFYQGHYYSDKPPGVALAGIAPYALLKLALSNPLGDQLLDKLSKSSAFSQAFTEGSNRGASESVPRDQLIGALGRILLSILLVSVPVALMLCLFWLFTCRVVQNYRLSLALTLALGLGTTLFPYSSLLYNHALTAALLFSAFYLLYRLKGQEATAGKLILVGFLFGYSLICQYETALIIAPLGLYALFTAVKSQWWKRFLWIVTGAIPPLLAMVIYDLIAFGTPMPIGYQYSILWLDKHNTGFMSLTYPHLDALWGLTFSPYRGMFLLSPFLLLAIPGFYFGLRSGGFKAETGVALFATVAFFLFNSSSIMWWGGHAFGPRYFVTALPFMVFGVALLLRQALQKYWRFTWLWFGVPAAISVAIVLPASLVGRQFPSDVVQSPLTEYLWPRLFSLSFAPNPGTAIGLKGLLSFIPLLFGLMVLYLLVYRIRRNKPSGSPRQVVRYNSTVELGPQKMTELKEKPENSLVKNSAVWLPVLSIALLLVFSSLPYLFGYLRAPQNKIFMGIMLDVPDTTQYWAWLREFQNNLVIQNPLTPEPNDPAFFNLLWLILGRFNSFTGLGVEIVYQLFRVASIIFFGWMSWKFCDFIFARPLARNAAYLLIMFGCGWGWIPVLIKQFSGTLSNFLAVFVAEPNTFMSALAFPHLIFSAGLMLGIFWLVLLAGESGNLRPAFGAAALALILGLEHTYDLLIVYGVIGVYWLWRCIRLRLIDWRWFRIGLVVALISSPPSLYSAVLTMFNPTWKGVLEQYDNAGVFTPDPFNLLLLMGPLLLVAFAGLIASPPPTLTSDQPLMANARSERLRFVKVWFGLGCFLIYIPTNFQIKMLNGWQIPIFMLAVAALFGPVKSVLLSIKLEKLARAEVLVVVLAIAVALPTTLYLFSWRFIDLNRTAEPYYLEKDEVAAIKWLSRTGDGVSIVLSSETLGQYLAAYTPHRPVLAHWAMTLDFYTKREISAAVLDPATSTDKRARLLQDNKVRYVLYGAAEKKVAPELNDPNLRRIFSTPKADVYLVVAGN